MTKMNTGEPAIAHSQTMSQMGTTQPMEVFSAGPIFDLTPHDAYTTPIMNPGMTPEFGHGAIDVLPSPYGPTYGALEAAVRARDRR